MTAADDLDLMIRSWTAATRAASSQQDAFVALYNDLRALARARLGALPPGNTFQPTALVHEVWLRLVSRQPDCRDEREFFGTAVRAMRDTLVEHVRAKQRLKRGGGLGRVDADALALELPAESGISQVDILELHEAIEKLRTLHARKAEIVELRFFGGLTNAQIARLLGIAERTVERDWRFARAWLRAAMDDSRPTGDDPTEDR